jgi:hypothetical protein
MRNKRFLSCQLLKLSHGPVVGTTCRIRAVNFKAFVGWSPTADRATETVPLSFVLFSPKI